MANAPFSFVFGLSDIEECKGNHSCHANANAQIPLDHKHVHATLDILEMDIVVQVNLIDFL